MSEERPLHVRVAASIGWTDISPCLTQWHGTTEHGTREALIPRFDTDWSATGPLIERFGIGVDRWNHATGGRAYWYACVWGPVPADDFREASNERTEETKGYDTPLEAICCLILVLKAAGKLPEGR